MSRCLVPPRMGLGLLVCPELTSPFEGRESAEALQVLEVIGIKERRDVPAQALVGLVIGGVECRGATLNAEGGPTTSCPDRSRDMCSYDPRECPVAAAPGTARSHHRLRDRVLRTAVPSG